MGMPPALRTGSLHKGRQRCQRGLSRVGDLRVVWKDHGEVFLSDRLDSTLIAVDDGNRCSPVALAGDPPVSEPVGDALIAQIVFLQVSSDGLSCLWALHTVKGARIDQNPLPLIGLCHRVFFELLSRRLDNDHEGKTVFLGEFEIPLIVARDRHDGTGPVLHENEICHEDRDPDPGDRVQTVGPCKDAFFFDVLRGPHGPVLPPDPLNKNPDRLCLRRSFREFKDQRMLWGKAHEGCSKHRILPCGKNGDNAG